jgi:hypothetical protein
LRRESLQPLALIHERLNFPRLLDGVDHELDDLHNLEFAPARGAMCRVGLDLDAKRVVDVPGAVRQDKVGRSAIWASHVTELNFQMSEAGFLAHERASPRDEEFSKNSGFLLRIDWMSSCQLR